MIDPNLDNLSKRIDLMFEKLHQIKNEVDLLRKQYENPKDELFEKWCNFLEWFDPEFANSGGPTIKTNFEKAKSLGLLKDPKDKVIALDEAIDGIEEHLHLTYSTGRPPEIAETMLNGMKEIRSKYTKEAK